MTGDYVYLFSNFNAELSAARNDIDLYIPQVQGKAIDSGSILLPQYVRGNQYTVISAFSLKDPGRKLDSKAVFGSSGLVYVSGSSIYVCCLLYTSPADDAAIHRYEYIKSDCTWTEAFQDCLNRGGYPVSYTHLKKILKLMVPI